MAIAGRSGGNENNRVRSQDSAAHEWYRFVLSFPPHLVRDILGRFQLQHHHRVLDPFCGTGTTLVECKKQRIASVGIEASPLAHFASTVKVDWTPDPTGLREHAQWIGEAALAQLRSEGIEDSPLLLSTGDTTGISLRTLAPKREKLLLKDSISPLPLHKVLVLLGCIERHRDEKYFRHERLALAKALVFSISNLRFGPEVGIGQIKADAPVVYAWLEEIRSIATDLAQLQGLKDIPAKALLADARQPLDVLEPASIDAVITSPPYPNEKDYTRTTRLESVLLGFVNSRADLRTIKTNLVRSNTRSVYKIDDDDKWIEGQGEIQRIATAIEERRIALGKTSGFERLYPRVTKLYFGGMARHLANLGATLRPGAQLAYVVGDQASYLRVMIRTGKILADIAASLGYQVVDIDLFRTRFATATRKELREEVIFLRWPGRP